MLSFPLILLGLTSAFVSGVPTNITSAISLNAGPDNVFRVPNSKISLDIRLDQRKTLSLATITTLLDGAYQKASRKRQADVLEGIFRHTADQGAFATPEQAIFGMIGLNFSKRLTWGDISVIIKGLMNWYEQQGRPEYYGVLFYVQDDVRGAIGDGYLEAGEMEDVTA